MPNETDTLQYKYFKLRYSTGFFILLSILSCGIYAYFWFIKLLEKFPKEDVKYSILLVFAVIAIPEWLDLFDLFFNFSEKTYNRIIYWCLIAIPYLSYNYRDEFRNFVAKDGVSVNISTLYLVIFPVFYQYYILRNTYNGNKPQLNEPLITNVSDSNTANNLDFHEISENAASSNAEINKQHKSVDKEYLRNKLIKLNSFYRDGKITKEQYDKYIDYLKSQLR